MTPEVFVETILDPGIAWCQSVSGWHVPFDDRARVPLVAIAGQESAWSARIQGGKTPAAHSFWQFERLGGVKGVLTHPATMDLAHKASAALNVLPVATNVWGIMATEAGDHLSVAFSRLLLWSDPHHLPPVGNEEAAWDYYVRNWRPGKPSRERWHDVYPKAVAAILPEKKA